MKEFGANELLYRDAMHRFCLSYLYAVEDAEDAVQDIFCKVLASEKIPGNFRAWLYRIARNHCLDSLRHRKPRQGQKPLPSSSHLDANLTGNSTRMIKREFRSRLAKELDRLSPAHREVLSLRYTEGLSRAEVAEVLSIPVSVVKSRLFEGIKKLRDAVGPEG